MLYRHLPYNQSRNIRTFFFRIIAELCKIKWNRTAVYIYSLRQHLETSKFVGFYPQTDLENFMLYTHICLMTKQTLSFFFFVNELHQCSEEMIFAIFITVKKLFSSHDTFIAVIKYFAPVLTFKSADLENVYVFFIIIYGKKSHYLLVILSKKSNYTIIHS